MKNKKKTFSAGMNVGSSSILVTFVLLCLVTFAALSFVSANADHELAVETADRISEYYRADNMAEIYLANIDSLLSKHASECDESTYYKDVEQVFSDNSNYNITRSGEDVFIDYYVEISEIQNLHVTVKVIYPTHPTADSFEITEWENISTYVPTETTTFEEEKGGLLF
ncbi:MAG: hypothetical protein Q4D29_02665 [Lachnospiraceae bacterium]|nr:hypothetical protein [Lachnospiraceae bacterium]